ncbi:MAG: lmo0937 family membrane protein [Deltaproteobacteria bacterium]|nr:lmo0937 family membrane protein [Deltaproteobacteria bacterium]
MLYILALVLAVAWLLGYGAFNVTSSLIHLVLVAAVVVLLLQLISGRRRI